MGKRVWGKVHLSISNLQDDLTLDVAIPFEFLSLPRLLQGKHFVYMRLDLSSVQQVSQFLQEARRWLCPHERCTNIIFGSILL